MRASRFFLGAGSAKNKREQDPLPFESVLFGWWSLMGNPSPNKNNKGGIHWATRPGIPQPWPTDDLLASSMDSKQCEMDCATIHSILCPGWDLEKR